jgi:pantoate kinase
MIGTFDSDWSSAAPAQPTAGVSDLINVPAKKVAKKVVRELNLGPAVEQALDRALDKKEDVQLEPKEVVEGVREAMREEVHAAVTQALHELVTAAAASDETARERKNGNE